MQGTNAEATATGVPSPTPTVQYPVPKSFRHVHWKHNCELPQLSLQCTLPEQLLVIVDDRHAIPITFAAISLGLVTMVLTCDVSEEVRSYLSVVTGIQHLTPKLLSPSFLKPIFERRSFSLCICSLSEDYLYTYEAFKDHLNCPTVFLSTSFPHRFQTTPLSIQVNAGSFGYIVDGFKWFLSLPEENFL